jgi:regulator of protease activity HflC (stomatin/prohibitin superfamily)
VVRYLANVDFFKILTVGRGEGGRELKQRMQEAADRVNLGVEVLFVGLEGLHPPVLVGRAFDEVVGSMEMKHEETLKGERYAVEKVYEAQADALMVTSEARSYREERTQVPQAEAERFKRQLMAYRLAPQQYMLRTFLDVLENEGAQARKYIVTGHSSSEVLVLDLQEKIRQDLLDLDLEAAPR